MVLGSAPVQTQTIILIIAAVALLAAGLTLGYMIGRTYPSERVLEKEYDEGYETGHKQGYLHSVSPTVVTSHIASHGLMLVPATYEPEYDPDTWLHDQLMRTADWSARQMEIQLRWRNKQLRREAA
jgi:hypothetical protein